MALIYPNNYELREIGPVKVARLSQDRLGFKIMPLRNVNAGQVRWRQKDNTFGLQQLRGLDGSPSKVNRVGSTEYSYDPGVFGEFEQVGETELTRRAGSYSNPAPIDVSDIVVEMQDQLVARELDLQEYAIWTLLTTGTITIQGPGNMPTWTQTFVIQTLSGSDWSTASTATPLADFRSAALLGAGKGISFGANSMAVMNRVTATRMLANTNASDIFGRRAGGGNTLNSLVDANRILADNDLPQIEIYDEGYLNDSNTFTRYVADDKVVVIGARVSGEQVGEYVVTRNANNPGMAAGSYEMVIDQTQNPMARPPKTVEYHRGHNGGPVLYFPSAVIVASV